MSPHLLVSSPSYYASLEPNTKQLLPITLRLKDRPSNLMRRYLQHKDTTWQSPN